MTHRDEPLPQPIRCLYLHGFASGPGSTKAQHALRRFSQLGWELEVLDLNPPDFRDLTVGGMIETVERAIGNGDEPVALVGSSLGGYLATVIASRSPRVEALVLLAPAFELRSRWIERLGPAALATWKRLGEMSIEHYARVERQPLAYRFLEESGGYPEYPEVDGRPVLIYHGRQDETVSFEVAERFAARTPKAELHLVDDGHDLHESLPDILDGIVEFLTARGWES